MPGRVAINIQIDARKRDSPILRLGQQHSIHDAFRHLAVRMAEQNHVNPRHLIGQLQDLIFTG